jgi:hypothetical protein
MINESENKRKKKQKQDFQFGPTAQDTFRSRRNDFGSDLSTEPNGTKSADDLREEWHRFSKTKNLLKPVLHLKRPKPRDRNQWKTSEFQSS